jgi:hypothetical protein
MSPQFDLYAELLASVIFPFVWAECDVVEEKKLLKETFAQSYFHACIYEEFESDAWESRFEALNLAFGLFLKINEQLYISNEGKFWVLGPLVSYIVSCLIDDHVS